MADTVLVVSLFAAAAAMLGLGGFLLYVRFNSPVNRAFAVYLVVYAGSLALFALAGLDFSSHTAAFFRRAQETFAIGSVAALLHFVATYLAWRARQRWLVARALAAAIGFAAVVAYMVNPCLAACGEPGHYTLGGFALLITGHSVALGLAAIALAVDWLVRGPIPGHRAALMLCAAFTVNAIFEGALFMSSLGLGSLAGVEPNAWAHLVKPWRAFALPLGVLTLAIFAAAHRRVGQGTVLLLLVAGLFAFVSGTYTGMQPPTSPGSTLLVALWKIAIPALAAYALVRHRLFGLEVRLRRVLARTILAMMLLTAVFGVASAAQAALGDYGNLSGWLAAGALLIGIQPLDRAAQRLARSVMPHSGPLAAMEPEERVALYRDRVGTILADGGMGLEDRRLLDRLKDDLQLPAEWAARIEREVWVTASSKRSTASPEKARPAK